MLSLFPFQLLELLFFFFNYLPFFCLNYFSGCLGISKNIKKTLAVLFSLYLIRFSQQLQMGNFEARELKRRTENSA